MTVEFAGEQYEKNINIFFGKYLDKNNDAITCKEFLCPYGVKAAIKRRQIIVIFNDDEKIIAAVRFYPRKRDGAVSVYQFAIDEKHRRKGLLKKMLIITGYSLFEILCPLNSEFNNYYKKTSWDLKMSDKKYNYWNLSL